MLDILAPAEALAEEMRLQKEREEEERKVLTSTRHEGLQLCHDSYYNMWPCTMACMCRSIDCSVLRTASRFFCFSSRSAILRFRN